MHATQCSWKFSLSVSQSPAFCLTKQRADLYFAQIFHCAAAKLLSDRGYFLTDMSDGQTDFREHWLLHTKI